jgi:hypothetical protein
MDSQIALVPGVYSGQTGKKRTLIDILGHTCIYTFDEVESLFLADSTTGRPTVRATTCTPRSFIAAVGDSPRRTFSEQEARYLRSGVVSFRPRRLCNKKERMLFFPPEEESTDQKTAADTSVVTPKVVTVTSVVAKPTDGDRPKEANKPVYHRLQEGFRKMLRRS